MIKIIHFVKVGNCELSDFEIYCIDTWKNIYPDFEIKMWDTDHNLDLIQDCNFAKKYFKEGGTGFGYVSDYMKLKVLYEFGGITADTDVIAYRRIPDKYFKKSFIPWTNSNHGDCTNNGTCHYSNKVHDPLVLDMINFYRTGDLYKLNYAEPSNVVIDEVLRKKKKMTVYNGCTIEDQELRGITIVNHSKFGCFCFDTKTMATEYPYLIHCRTFTWKGKMKGNAILCFVLNDDTTYDDLDLYISQYLSIRKAIPDSAYLLIFYNSLKGKDCKIIDYLNNQLKFTKVKDYNVLTLGSGLSESEVQKYSLDFASKRFNECLLFNNLKYKLYPIKNKEPIFDSVSVDYAIGTNFEYDKKDNHRLVVFKSSIEGDNKKKAPSYADIVDFSDIRTSGDLYNAINNYLMTIYKNVKVFKKIN